MATSKNYGAAVNALLPVYPKANKAAVSHAMNTQATGVTFTATAKRLLGGILFPKRKRENRKHPERWVFRLTEEQSARLEAVKTKYGFSTRQDLMQFIINKILEAQNG
jgi:hypothetical protein